MHFHVAECPLKAVIYTIGSKAALCVKNVATEGHLNIFRLILNIPRGVLWGPQRTPRGILLANFC